MRLRVASWGLAGFLTLSVGSAGSLKADGVDDGGGHPLVAELLAAAAEAPGDPVAPLWRHRDRSLQAAVERAIDRLGLRKATQSRRLAVALVDSSDAEHPRVAAINGDEMMYAASLPKIAILLGAFDKADRGELQLDDETESSLTAMIRYSSNQDATRMLHRVGVEDVARVLLSPRYRFYDPDHNGGLWVGKDYGKAGLWLRDPIHNLSHGATPLQVARFYYLLQRGELVSASASEKMREILGDTGIQHKFAKGLQSRRPRARLWRKSGTWQTFHADSALVERDGRTYIAVALANSPRGGEWLPALIGAFDDIIAVRSPAQNVLAARK